MYLANSDHKHPLNEHLIGVAKLSMEAARHLGLPKELVELCGVAGMLHDIGKILPSFQSYILGEDVESSKEFIRHNELSWAFCNDYFKYPDDKFLFKVNQSFLQAIFWHHGTNRNDKEIKSTNSTKILEGVGDNVVQKIKDFVLEISKESPVPLSKYLDAEPLGDNKPIPLLFEKTNKDNINTKYLAIRSCLIFADHHISKINTDELRELIEKEDFSKFFPIRTLNASFENIPEKYDVNRFTDQKNIVAECDRVSIVKGPAGFGKTLVGLMWGVQQGGQIYWVVPRNAVAESVYRNIISELNVFESNLSVELYLTGERKESYGNVCESPCTADIVVTNIDNLLSPIVSDRDVRRLFAVNAATIVFDEFHEFINEEAMFAAFITYMKLRQLFAKNTRTLLLSATPSILNIFWDSQESKTKILPDNNNHYPAQHDKKYFVKLSSNEFEHRSTDSNSLMVMYNSVRNVQEKFKNGGFDHIAHSKFSDEDRKKKLESIFNTFGKNGTGEGKIISAPVLQSSADISVKQLFRVSESPEADIQTIGRVNRWGREASAIIYLSDFSNRSESSSIKVRYKNSLSARWFKFLKDNISKPVTLDELYTIYNEFNSFHKCDIKSFIKSRLDESLDRLSTYYPKTIKKNSDRKISGKTLRRLSPSYFVAVKTSGSDKWHSFAFQFTDFELQKYLDDKVFTFSEEKQYELYKELKLADFDTTPVLEYMKPPRREVNNKGKKFKTKSNTQRLNDEEIIRFSHDANCPIPIFNLLYSPEIGLY